MVAAQMTVIQSAPAFAQFLATVVPASAHFVSATIFLSGNNALKLLIVVSPVCNKRIVPASIISTTSPTFLISAKALGKSE